MRNKEEDGVREGGVGKSQQWKQRSPVGNISLADGAKAQLTFYLEGHPHFPTGGTLAVGWLVSGVLRHGHAGEDQQRVIGAYASTSLVQCTLTTVDWAMLEM